MLGPEVVKKMSPELREELADPAFAAMMLALGKISGYAFVINNAKTDDIHDTNRYNQSKSYFKNLWNQPSSFFSTQLFKQTANGIDWLGSKVYNPESREIDKANEFFALLKSDAGLKKALAEVWEDLPPEFINELKKENFLDAITGEQGKYVPSPEAIQATLEKIMSTLKFSYHIHKYF